MSTKKQQKKLVCKNRLTLRLVVLVEVHMLLRPHHHLLQVVVHRLLPLAAKVGRLLPIQVVVAGQVLVLRTHCIKLGGLQLRMGGSRVEASATTLGRWLLHVRVGVREYTRLHAITIGCLLI